MNVLLFLYDNESHLNIFPLSSAYIASAIRSIDKAINLFVYEQNIYHYPDKHLTQYIDKNNIDIIGIGMVAGYYEYKKLKNVILAINKAKKRPIIILGGHMFTPDPEYFLRLTDADYVVIGEGENTIKELLSSILNKSSIKDIKGIAYFNGDNVVINEKRGLIKDIDTITFPAWDLFTIPSYSLYRHPGIKSNQLSLAMLTGRGCKFNCNFCYRIDKGFRPRSNESIIEEIKILKKDYNITYFAFMDELTMSSESRIVSLCEDIVKEKLGINWYCNGRLNYATKDVLRVMKKAGCSFINYGIESLDNQVLKNMNKRLNVKQIKKGIENTIKCGIHPGFNIIWGNYGDNYNTLMAGVDFLLTYDDQGQKRTIRPVTPYPGCPLYYDAIEKGLLNDIQDFYENKHKNSEFLTVNFTELTDEDFHESLYIANVVLLRNYYKKINERTSLELEDLYKNKNYNFRGFR